MSTSFRQSAGVGPIQQWHGVYAAKVIVTSGVAVKLRMPQVLGAAESNWAVPLNPGMGITPTAGATVYAMFLGGDITVPVYIVPGNNVTTSVINNAITSRIDTNGADFSPAGVPAPGGSGKLADATHTHPGAGMTGSLTAFQPGTTIPETWHTVTSFTAPWANAAGRIAAQYRLVAAPPNEVEIIGSVAPSAATGAPAVVFTLPAGYQPPHVGNSGVARNMTGAVTTLMSCDTGGNVDMQNPVAINQVVDFHWFISLDA